MGIACVIAGLVVIIAAVLMIFSNYGWWSRKEEKRELEAEIQRWKERNSPGPEGNTNNERG